MKREGPPTASVPSPPWIRHWFIYAEHLILENSKVGELIHSPRGSLMGGQFISPNSFSQIRLPNARPII